MNQSKNLNPNFIRNKIGETLIDIYVRRIWIWTCDPLFKLQRAARSPTTQRDKNYAMWGPPNLAKLNLIAEGVML